MTTTLKMICIRLKHICDNLKCICDNFFALQTNLDRQQHPWQAWTSKIIMQCERNGIFCIKLEGSLIYGVCETGWSIVFPWLLMHPETASFMNETTCCNIINIIHWSCWEMSSSWEYSKFAVWEFTFLF